MKSLLDRHLMQPRCVIEHHPRLDLFAITVASLLSPINRPLQLCKRRGIHRSPRTWRRVQWCGACLLQSIAPYALQI